MRAERFAAVASRLGKTLERCADETGVEDVHQARTGSRRLDAALDALERETCGGKSVRKSAAKLRKLTKKVRRRAGKVRDLDVHRGLLRKLTPELDSGAVDVKDEADGGAILRQAAELDAVLERRREKAATKLRQRACRLQEKLEQRAEAVLEAAREAGDPPADAEAAELALESFAELCREIPVLDTGTLHEFRKGAKHARYIAEGGDDAWSKRTAKRLKRVQDTIGLWHDWLVLAAEAEEEAGGGKTDLVQRLEAKRERQFNSAMRTTERVRKELLAEWSEHSGWNEGPGRAGEEILVKKSA